MTDPTPITKPGLYPNIPEADYHADKHTPEPSISSTGVRQMLDCPARFWAHSPHNPDRVVRASTAALNFGSAAHKWLLEPGYFERAFHVTPPGFSRSKTKVMAAEIAEADAAIESGKREISEGDVETIKAMKAALEVNPLIRKLLANCAVEQSAFWIEQTDNGPVWCRQRSDGLPHSRSFILDYKTCQSAAPNDVGRSLVNYGYHIQGAHYMAGERALGGDPQKFFLLFQEKTPPYLAEIYEIDDVTLAIGEQKRAEALNAFARCLQSNDWPGYGNGRVLSAGLPEWAIKRETQQLEMAA